MRRSQADSTNRSLASFGKLQHIRLESINALVEERCAKVDHWQNSSQRHRWLATALLRHRTALAEGDRLPPPAQAPCRAEARTEDRHGDVEEESCVSQEP